LHDRSASSWWTAWSTTPRPGVGTAPPSRRWDGGSGRRRAAGAGVAMVLLESGSILSRGWLLNAFDGRVGLAVSAWPWYRSRAVVRECVSYKMTAMITAAKDVASVDATTHTAGAILHSTRGMPWGRRRLERWCELESRSRTGAVIADAAMTVCTSRRHAKIETTGDPERLTCRIRNRA
jgi:hypothetical protein